MALEARRQFYEVVKAAKMMGVTENALQLARDRRAPRTRALRGGFRLAERRAEGAVRTAQSQLDSIAARQSVLVQRDLLASFIGLEEARLGEVDTVLTVTPREYDESSVLREAEANRPDLKAAEADVKAARAGLTAARLSWLPYVSVSGSATYDPVSTSTSTVPDSNGTLTTISGRNEADRQVSGRVALSWDFFDGLATSSRNASARARLARAQAAYDVLRRNLAGRGARGAPDVPAGPRRPRRSRAAASNPPAESMKLTQQKYNVGSATILDLIDAQVQLQRAQSQFVSALAGIRVAEARIDTGARQRRLTAREEGVPQVKKKKWLWIGVAVALVAAVVVANVVRGRAGKVEAVQLARVRLEDITSRVRAPGKIEAKTQVKVSADIMGKIVVLAVKEGDRVRKGQLMLQLDDTQYRAYDGQARATAASARARAREAEQTLKGAEATYRRQQALFEQRLLSEAEKDQADSAIQAARSAAQAARQEVLRADATVVAAADNLRKTRFDRPVRRRGERAERRGGGERDHRHHEQPRHGDPGRLGSLADAREGRRGRDGRRGHEARAEGEDHRGCPARHVVPRNRHRGRQHGEALAHLGGRRADQLRGQGRLRRGRARRCGRG